MKFFIIINLSIIFLCGCSSTPTQSLSQTPIEIEQSDLNKYWQQTQKHFRFNTKSLKEPTTNGIVKLKYLIDSNGQIFSPIIVKSVPKGMWDEFALNALKNLQYIKSESNVTGIPVYVTTKFEFGTGKT